MAAEQKLRKIVFPEPDYRVGGCRIYQGDSRLRLAELPAGSVHCAVTSPPYYNLRDYGTGRWEGGDPDCAHAAAKKKSRFDYQLGPSGKVHKEESRSRGPGSGTDAPRYQKECPDCGAVRIDEQLGIEETPQEYVRNMVGVFSLVKRALRDDGTFWLNVADSYANTGGRTGQVVTSQRKNRANVEAQNEVKGSLPPGYQSGSLMGIPWMLVEAMRADGWLLRAEIIWTKLSAMPESVAGWRWERCRVKIRRSRGATAGYNAKAAASAHGVADKGGIDGSAEYEDCPGCDRCKAHDGLVLRRGSWRPTRAHEQIFLFTKTDSYYCDGIAVKQPARDSTVVRDRYTRLLDDEDEQFAVKHNHETQSGGTSNLRSWLIFKGEPLRDAHYASFPSGLPRLAVLAGTSGRGVCPRCGAPWARVVETERSGTPLDHTGDTKNAALYADSTNQLGPDVVRAQRTLGWRPTCGCPEHEPAPAIVLEPFLGSGTTARVCEQHNRLCVGFELSGEFIDISRRRIEQARRNKGFGL